MKFDSENGKILVDITDEIAIKDLVQIEFINQSGELDYQSFVINSRDYDEGTMSETVNPTVRMRMMITMVIMKVVLEVEEIMALMDFLSALRFYQVQLMKILLY